MNSIPLHKPRMGEFCAKNVADCIEHAFLAQGPYVPLFEKMLRECLGVKHAVAVSSGTAALHLALKCVGVEPGDEVVTSDLTFIAPANAIAYCGAHPVFIDADYESWEMSPRKLDDFLNSCEIVSSKVFNPISHRRVAAVLPVSILGEPVDASVYSVSVCYGLPIVEDHAQSFGLNLLGDIACLSFNANKTITTGGGGAVLTNTLSHAQRVAHLKHYAMRDFDYIHDEVGYNYRMGEVAAAIGTAQMVEYAWIFRRKGQIHEAYERVAKEMDVPFPLQPFWRWLDCLYDERDDAAQLVAHFKEHGIETRRLWQPMHMSAAHAGALTVGGKAAEEIYKHAVMIPSGLELNEDELRHVVSVYSLLK